MIRVYVAGAYNASNVIGVLDNMRKGMELSLKVLKAGFAPFVPWFDYHFALMSEMTLEEYRAYSMAWLEGSHVVLIQPDGAEKSEGTQAEIARAEELDMPVFYSMEELTLWAEALE